jgi:hypothetical protein
MIYSRLEYDSQTETAKFYLKKLRYTFDNHGLSFYWEPPMMYIEVKMSLDDAERMARFVEHSIKIAENLKSNV